MDAVIRDFTAEDAAAAAAIWNEVVRDGVAFPQENELSPEEALAFFTAQTRTRLAVTAEGPVGLYILHPNNVGRCGHIANTSYAVRSDCRGRRIGEMLVRDSLAMARACGFRILQFNAVVAANHPALHLYKKLGFILLGTIPGGFRMKDGHYEDIHPMYHLLEERS